MSKYLLIPILILSALFRFWDTNSTPRGLYIDEISLGWNTHLISTTGRDEYGQFLPIAFRAFGEFKLPGYIYATVPVFWLFGPGIWQLRFVSALAGVLGLLAIYLLTKTLLNPSNDREKSTEGIAIISALIFAITPWSIQLSRAAFEANLALTTSLFALYFLLKLRHRAGEKQFSYIILWLCIFCFVFAFYTYNSTRLFLPILFTLTLLIWRKQYSKSVVTITIASILIFTAPAVVGFTTGGESTRAQQVLEFGHQQLELGPLNGTLYKYFDHFSAAFLFFKGDPVGRHSVRELGVLPIPLLIFLPIGLYLVAKKISDPANSLLLAWLIFSPIPSAIATPSPHALRAIYMLPPLVIISSIGLVNFYQTISTKFKILFCGFAFCIFSYSLVTYQHVYYVHWSPQMWPEWSEHWTKAAQYIAKTYPNTARVVMEESPVTEYYLKFFDAIEGNTITRNFTGLEHVYTIYLTIEDGAVVGTAGWKDTPPQLTNVHQIIAANQNHDVIYKVGIWRPE